MHVAELLLLCVTLGSPATGEDPVVLYDMRGLRELDISTEVGRLDLWDTCHLISGLQGLANRDGARLYVLFVEPWDRYWLEKLRAPGKWLHAREVVHVESLDSLLERFRESYRGVVAYTMEPASLSNVASTICGVEGLLPVRFDARSGSLYDRVVVRGPRLPVVVDLTQEEFPKSTGSRKCDPYEWARLRYLETGRCEPDTLAYTIDGYWLQDPFRGNHENHTLSNHDYFIARKAFFFDLSPWDDETPVDEPGQQLGADVRTLQAILRSAYERTRGETIVHVGGFVPWAWKYCNHAPGAGRHPPVASEWKYAEILSAYNAMMDADALGPCAMANASFFTHFPLEDRYPQEPRPGDVELRKAGWLGDDGLVAPGAYVAFYVGDYDSAAWLYREFPRAWDDPNRGHVPMGWALNPNLERRAPMALVYARETKTPLDVFTTGDSGAGYLNPGALQEPRPYSGLPSGVSVWESFCKPLYERWDLSVTGFVIDGSSPPMREEAWDAYARFSPGGLGGQKTPPQGVYKGMPFLRVADTGGSPGDAADQLAAMVSPERRSFFYIRTILKSATWHKEFADQLHERQPSARVVDPHTLFALLSRYERDKERYPRPVWSKSVVSWEGGVDDGLRAIPYADGPIRSEEVSGRRAIVSRAERSTRYVYLAVHDGFPEGEPETIIAEVTYLDRGQGRISVHYNGPTSAYAGTSAIRLQDTGRWETARFRLTEALFSNQQNACADLRIANEGATLAVSRIVLLRRSSAPGRREKDGD